MRKCVWSEFNGTGCFDLISMFELYLEIRK